MGWYVAVLKKYVDFSGRARRMEFWMFTLISAIISIVLSVIDQLIHTAPYSSHGIHLVGLLSGIYGLAVLLPTLAVQVRRLHDTDRRGWWIFIAIIPIIGGIILLVLNILPGQNGDNRFGPDPKATPHPTPDLN